MNPIPTQRPVWIYRNGCDDPAELAWLKQTLPHAVELDRLPEEDHLGDGQSALACLWLGLRDSEQIEQFKRLTTRWPRLSPVVVVPEHASDPNVVATLRAGAVDCLRQPVDQVRFELAIERALERVDLLGQIEALSQRVSERQAEEIYSLRELERLAIRRALDKTNGCMSQAARLLGIGRATIYRKIASFQAAGTPV